MKEHIYDDKIAPMMAEIIAICKEAKISKISLIADFGLDEDLHCTSALLDDEYDPTVNQLKSLRMLRPTAPVCLTETIQELPSGSKRITIGRI